MKTRIRIASFTYLVLPTQVSGREGLTLRELAHYVLTEGQLFTTSLGYVPLPRHFAERQLVAIDEVLGTGMVASISGGSHQ
jgi:hypothetical protein